MNVYNYDATYNDGSLTRGEALDAVNEAETKGFGALCELAEAWMGHSLHGYGSAESYKYAEFLRGYVSEACMDLDGDAIRSNGPKDSDYTGISS